MRQFLIAVFCILAVGAGGASARVNMDGEKINPCDRLGGYYDEWACFAEGGGGENGGGGGGGGGGAEWSVGVCVYCSWRDDTETCRATRDNGACSCRWDTKQRRCIASGICISTNQKP